VTATLPTFWTDDRIRAEATLPAVIDAVQRVLEHEAAGTAWNIDKTMTTWAPTASAHALGAVDVAGDLVVFKTWVNTPAGANAVVTAFAAEDGALRAVLPGGVLGPLRTAAISGVATRWLSAPDADELAVLGAGRQAFGQVAAVAAVRPLRRVRVWSRTPGTGAALAQRIHAELGIRSDVASSVDDATRDAPVVTTITRATEPFLRLAHLAEGAHLNAVGAILPANAEFDPALLAAADPTVVDSEPNARRGSRELTEHDDWAEVSTLAQVVTGAVVRPERPRCTVFKGMGMGLSDLAVVQLLLTASQGGNHD
jgi:alanine dehydrogenase